MMNKKIILKLGFLSIFLLLINVSTIYSYYFPIVSTICLILGGGICLLLLTLNIRKFKIPKLCFLFLISWFFALLIPSIFTEISISLIWYYVKFIVIFIDVIILKINDIDVKYILFRCSTLFMFWALINSVVMSSFGASLPVTGSYITSWGKINNLHLFFFYNNQSGIELNGISFMRVHVPFSEPGNAQIYFNYGLLYCLFILKKSKKRKYLTILFALASILTISMTGYLIFGLIIFMYLAKNKKYFLLLPYIILSFCVIYIITINKLDSISYLDRKNDLIFMIDKFFEFFPFGCGYGNADLLGERILSDGTVGNPGMFSGLFSPLTSLGIFSIVFYVLLIISIKFFDGKNKFNNFVFGIYILLSLFTEPQAFSLIMTAFIINGMINYSEQKNRYVIHYYNKRYRKLRCLL